MRDLEGFITAMGWSGVRARWSFRGCDGDRFACLRAAGPDRTRGAGRAGDFRVAGRAGTWMAQSVYRADAEAQADFRQRRGDVLELREQAAVQHLAQGHSARLLRVRHAADERRQAGTEVRAGDRGEVLRDGARFRRARANSPLHGAVAGDVRRARRLARRFRWPENRGEAQAWPRDDVPDTGHFLPMEKPDLVAEMAVDFLSEK